MVAAPQGIELPAFARAGRGGPEGLEREPPSSMVFDEERLLGRTATDGAANSPG